MSSPRPAIDDYGLVGDGRSAALVARDGSLDWLCWPRFDSHPLFTRLLDEDGGAWTLTPTEAAHVRRRYRADTNVLETTFENGSGACVVVDFMPVCSADDTRHLLVAEHEIVRRIHCERGAMELTVRVDPRPGFAKRFRVSHHRALGVRWERGRELLTLQASVPMRVDERGASTTFVLHAGETASFSLAYASEAPAVLPTLDRVDDRLDRTTAWWQCWADRAQYDGAYRDLVIRSALTIKLMAFAPSGAIVAAPTTSLPEVPGSSHNWDYRFCWLRDAAFTARAFLALGYTDEASAFCDWLVHATRLTQPELRILYDVYGNRPERERIVEAATGYGHARPVRTGNAADQQLQLDCYGEVIDAASQVARLRGHIDGDTCKLLCGFGNYVCANWRKPDQGIWEPRGAPEHRTHSRLLSWVALDRLLDLANAGLLDSVDRDRLAAERTAIRADLEANAFDPGQRCYTGTYGNPELDASVLLMSWYGFHQASSPRMRSTFDRIRDRLSAAPGLFYRYQDSRRKGEGAFWLCSFWAVEHLANAGAHDEAVALMDRACSYANDVGLMAEEVDAHTFRALGNFPQTYTHVGLISAAVTLAQVAQTSRAPYTARMPATQPAEVRR